MFERYTCWDAASATKILRPLALEGNESVFRATHSPISGLVITGTEAHSVHTATEEGLLTSLSSSERRHAMCVVEGEAGSGKSHLIRWLKVHWPTGNELVVLIERADGTLDGTLRQLKDKLSNEAGTSFDAIVPRSKLTEQGQRDSLLSQLAAFCRSGTLTEPLGDDDWCEKHGLSDMLLSEAVRTQWKAPERVLAVLTQGADRDSKVARFTARDVVELRQPLAGLRGRNVGPGAIRLAHLLREEGPAVASAIDNGPPNADEVDVSAVAPNTSKFLAALNSRLSLAIQSAMGISGAALQKMFRELRRSLRKEGKRLVLLLEDLTNAQGVDQELLYLLQESSTTQDQFCDIVSVVGITPAYFRQYIAPQANVVQRVTHHVRFGRVEGSFQAVAGLDERAEQVAFAARYLRAVRAGIDEIEQVRGDPRAITNRCTDCQYRSECHAAFGADQGVGLYPFTAKSIDRMFSSLKDPKGAMFLQTPRAMIQAVLAPSIAVGRAIQAGSFPVPSIETEWHPSSKCEVHGLAYELIERAPVELQGRLRIAVAWWGDGAIPIDGDAPEEWAGVPRGVFQAWGLTPPATAVSAAIPTKQHVKPISAPNPEAAQNAALPAPEPVSRKAEAAAIATPKEPSKPVKRAAPKTKFEEQVVRLRNWTKTGKLEDDGFWADRARAFIGKVAWKDEDIPHWFSDEALGEVRLKGSGKTDHRNVVIPCDPWVARGLEWSARLEFKELSQGEYETAMQAISVFANNARRVVLAWIASRVPEIKPGLVWDFGATVVQVLLVRVWLRGETRPGAPLVEQWKCILSDDSTSGASRRPGAQAWNTAAEGLAADSQLHKRLRTLADCSKAVVDVAFAAPAIRQLVEDATFMPFPETVVDQPSKTKWLSELVSSAKIAENALSALPAKEVTRLRDRATLLLDTAGPTGFKLYVERAAQAFGRVRQELPNHAAGALAEWVQLYESKQGLLKPGPGSEHDRLQTFLDARSLQSLRAEAPLPHLLDAAIQTPADHLEGMYALVKETSKLIISLIDYFAQYEGAGASLQDSAAVTGFGQRLADKAEDFKAVVS